jgi:protein-S-isoprenylcysteine O-methyltransferase Ste14
VHSFFFQRGFILPVTVTGIIPLCIVIATKAWRDASLPALLVGSLFSLVGLWLFILTAGLFAKHHGSLAPWNPPAQMVVVGPYRYCRNPMISGVYAMLLGETIALLSPWIGLWALVFVIGMSSHIVFQEEPRLHERFGEPYARYCKHVPRWLPRLSPYRP